jgi:TPR repeat protein
MPCLNDKRRFFLILVLSFACLPLLQAADNTTSSVFKFQQTMAQKGLASAQYKLAMMYETGDGIPQDLNSARNWYQQAQTQSYKPAGHRLKYLDIAQNHTPADRDWLKQLHQDAQAGNGEALFLLGQMYAAGTGVYQELHLAARYLRKASAENIPGSESELTQVEMAIAQKQQDDREKARLQADADKKLAQQKADAVEQQRIQQILLLKQLADAKQLQQQAMAKQQRTKARTQTPPKATALVSRQTVLPAVAPGSVIEVDLSPCSGRNRFASTCR